MAKISLSSQSPKTSKYAVRVLVREKETGQSMPEFPHELIGQLQICSRAAAGLPEYSPDDPTLPALPSLSATVAALEPSEPNLRCENCKGKLVRGVQSNICIYCGCRHKNGVVPDPICFTSTTGYQWLLTSLRLHGSEMVKPLKSKTEQDQGQSSPKAAIPLSDFLNYRVAWPAEPEKEETSISDQHSEESKRSLSLTRGGLDNFFPKLKRDASDTSSEQSIVLNQTWTTETKEVAALDSPNLFQNVQSSDPAGISLKEKGREVFSEWEADFQSADSENQQSVSKSSDHFMGSSADSANKVQDSESLNHFTGLEVDLGAHMDSVFGPGNDLNDGERKDVAAASTAFTDWNPDDMWNNLGSNKSQLIGGFDDIVGSKDDQKVESSNDLSPSVDLLQDFEWQTNNTYVTANTTAGNEHVMINEEPFDEWDDFTGSGSGSQVPSGNVRIEFNDLLSTSEKRSSEIDLFSSNSKFDGDFSSFSEPNMHATSTSNSYFPTEVNAAISEDRASESSNNATGASQEFGEFGQTAKKSGDSLSKPTEAKDEVKMLISQMHDLSFMLETDLSIPSGTDAHKSFP